MGKLQLMNYNGFQTLVSGELAVRPIFQDHIRWRTNQKLCTNICLTGEPGIGKSYQAIDIARVFEGIYQSSSGEWKQRLKLEQIVFTHSDYMELLLRLKMGKVVIFDEPSYAMGKRDWFQDIQKVLVHTLESQRFLIHPLFIPIINMSLLDKTIRSYLIQFQIHVLGRGHAYVYRMSPSQATDKIYREFMCELFYHQFDSHLCYKDSCLGCKKIESCQIFRAQYERKKRSTQVIRYEQAKDQAQQKESADLTDSQLETMVWNNIDKLLNSKGKLDVSKMRYFLRDEFKVHLSIWKGYNIKGLIEAAHPERFEEE
ncbi:MAG: hypothetical protein MUP17_09540 [candidate division Zixibacteria bacterium]|nr:hypothetical protein [candidate division Zixibacteria bacterium]